MSVPHRRPVPLSKAYRLLNHGPTVLVSAAHDGRRNIMAAAWAMPLDFEPPKVAVVLDKATWTRQLLEGAGTFVLQVPCAAQADLVLGQMKATVRRNYSSPPIHAAGIVSRVLGEPDLRAAWDADVAAMRTRIQAMRRSLHAVLQAKRPGRDFGYFLTQRGMFSYTGLSAAQVDRLREEFGVYLVRSGRMCVAGLNTGNVERTAAAMAAVMA